MNLKTKKITTNKLIILGFQGSQELAQTWLLLLKKLQLYELSELVFLFSLSFLFIKRDMVGPPIFVGSNEDSGLWIPLFLARHMTKACNFLQDLQKTSGR